MAINKGEKFGQGDVYVDYEFERVMFKWDFRENFFREKRYTESFMAKKRASYLFPKIIACITTHYYMEMR